jgi:hypothetical protein
LIHWHTDNKLNTNIIHNKYNTIHNKKTAIYNIYIMRESYIFQPGGQTFSLNILDDRDIFPFCRFRLNNHKLPVEYG